MSMYCDQCQEAAKNSACTLSGMCGKEESVSNLQDLLVYILSGIAQVIRSSGKKAERETARFMIEALFATVTNTNFDERRILELIRKALRIRDEMKKQSQGKVAASDAVSWGPGKEEDFVVKAGTCGIRSYDQDENARSLKTLILYGIKGLSAYTDHAAVLGFYDDSISEMLVEGLAALTQKKSADELTILVMKTGEAAVKAMALLDQANTETYGHPEVTKVNIGVRNNSGILISGHDLKDMGELLRQTEGTGVDVYTHCEMLPAHYYPAFKKYKHFAGNYGNAWWRQGEEFESFHGPVLMTTNCIVPVKDSYKERIFTTGMAGYPGIPHIPDRSGGKEKDFSALVALAKKCQPPKGIEKGEIVGGFAHHQVLALADKVVGAVKSGAIKRFVVMAGCDGRHPSRKYFTEAAQTLPDDAVILTAGCAKYRYNKLQLGDIGGIPRVLDAGQCNDSYSLAVIALKLKEVFGLEDINQLPVSFDIAWYEQKAVAVLLALLHLGVKGIRLGPTLPAFLSPGVAKVLVEKFNIKPTGSVPEDVKAILAGD